jgi:hypothetical protein
MKAKSCQIVGSVNGQEMGAYSEIFLLSFQRQLNYETMMGKAAGDEI